jgi:hypothetical protein
MRQREIKDAQKAKLFGTNFVGFAGLNFCEKLR